MHDEQHIQAAWCVYNSDIWRFFTWKHFNICHVQENEHKLKSVIFQILMPDVFAYMFAIDPWIGFSWGNFCFRFFPPFAPLFIFELVRMTHMCLSDLITSTNKKVTSSHEPSTKAQCKNVLEKNVQIKCLILCDGRTWNRDTENTLFMSSPNIYDYKYLHANVDFYANAKLLSLCLNRIFVWRKIIRTNEEKMEMHSDLVHSHFKYEARNDNKFFGWVMFVV